MRFCASRRPARRLCADWGSDRCGLSGCLKSGSSETRMAGEKWSSGLSALYRKAAALSVSNLLKCSRRGPATGEITAREFDDPRIAPGRGERVVTRICDRPIGDNQICTHPHVLARHRPRKDADFQLKDIKPTGTESVFFPLSADGLHIVEYRPALHSSELWRSRLGGA